MWARHIGVDSKGELGAVDDVQQQLVTFLLSEDTQSKLKVLVLEDVARDHHVSVEKLIATLEEIMKR
eukprot:CAMPEP_0176453944 /NCGR_PEP_ID=MMETSP0127-20121128/29578_1 /TAXON_ID=938130 /ORGANISM="Platyophrya macrostoma, Strain WH" /LENGTH=66 /DNA_ID=CAMNT_0017842977 /DNA_START=75 /DNA_END=271 /DNA_ORIENTATION=+